MTGRRPRDDVVLATTVHDPGGALVSRIEELLPGLQSVIAGVAAVLTRPVPEREVDLLAAHGVVTRREPHEPRGLAGIGAARRAAVALALEPAQGAHVLYADLDHALRWVEQDPADLMATLDVVTRHDLTVVGRTPAALADLPPTLGDTEAVVNRAFAARTGRAWDLMSGVRGLSPGCATAVVARCGEDSIGNDTAWPLFALAEGFDVGYTEAAGLAYEDTDQFVRRGDREGWRQRLARDPDQWLRRLDVARHAVAAMLPYRDVAVRPEEAERAEP